MASAAQEHLIHEIHARGVKLVIAVTGGGSGAISALLGVAGASRSILAATVPYSAAALGEWLGGMPDEFCAPRTARAMAMAALLKAQKYDPAGPTCGVACTASLASDRAKRGAHRAHLAWQSADTTATVSVTFEKGRRTRAEEEALVVTLVLNLIAEACGAGGRLDVPLAESESLASTRIVAPRDQQDLLAGRVRAICVRGDRATPPVLFPGAFHPLHPGHKKMAALAERILGHRVAFEISIENVDKPPLDFIEIDGRARQFSPPHDLWLSRAPQFVDKAELFPGTVFVVGADTIARVGQSRYYGGQPSAMQAALEQIARRGCRFLVFGRTMEGKFCTLSDLQLPETLATMCQAVPEHMFRDETSSTKLRGEAQP